MVDSNDRDRVVEARDELHRMLNEVTVDYNIGLLVLFLVIGVFNLCDYIIVSFCRMS